MSMPFIQSNAGELIKDVDREMEEERRAGLSKVLEAGRADRQADTDRFIRMGTVFLLGWVFGVIAGAVVFCTADVVRERQRHEQAAQVGAQ